MSGIESWDGRDELTVRDPGVDHAAVKAWERREIVGVTVALLGGIVTCGGAAALIITGSLVWGAVALLVLGTLLVILVAVVMDSQGECPGVLTLSAPHGDPLVAAVSRADGAARAAQAAARGLPPGGRADEALTWATALATITWAMAQAATTAPAQGPGRRAIAAEIARRAESMEAIALAAETTRWALETAEPMAGLDAFIDEAREAFRRLELP